MKLFLPEFSTSLKTGESWSKESTEYAAKLLLLLCASESNELKDFIRGIL